MVSCTKKSNSPTPTETKTQLLTGKNWKITAQTLNPGLDIGTGTLITDSYAYLMANGGHVHLIIFLILAQMEIIHGMKVQHYVIHRTLNYMILELGVFKTVKQL
jgi:hypothetical protein